MERIIEMADQNQAGGANDAGQQQQGGDKAGQQGGDKPGQQQQGGDKAGQQGDDANKRPGE